MQARRSSNVERPECLCLICSNLRDDILYLVITAISVHFDVALVSVDVRKHFPGKKSARHFWEPVKGLSIPCPSAAICLVSEVPVRGVPYICSRTNGLRFVVLLNRMV